MSVLKSFNGSNSDYSQSDTINLVLLTCLTNDGSCDSMSHLLVLILGEISMSHHYFNVGKHYCWQISRSKVRNNAIEKVIKELQNGSSKAEKFPTALVMSLTSDNKKLSEEAVPRIVFPIMENNGSMSYISKDNPMSFHLIEAGSGLRSKCQLRFGETVFDEIVSSFEQYEVGVIRYTV